MISLTAVYIHACICIYILRTKVRRNGVAGKLERPRNNSLSRTLGERKTHCTSGTYASPGVIRLYGSVNSRLSYIAMIFVYILLIEPGYTPDAHYRRGIARVQFCKALHKIRVQRAREIEISFVPRKASWRHRRSAFHFSLQKNFACR